MALSSKSTITTITARSFQKNVEIAVGNFFLWSFTVKFHIFFFQKCLQKPLEFNFQLPEFGFLIIPVHKY